jgi:hypothetical protein
MDAEQQWQQALQKAQAAGFRLFPLDQSFSEAALHTLAEVPPPAMIAFARLWNQAAPDAWQALVQSAASVHPEVIEDMTKPPHTHQVKPS